MKLSDWLPQDQKCPACQEKLSSFKGYGGDNVSCFSSAQHFSCFVNVNGINLRFVWENITVAYKQGGDKQSLRYEIIIDNVNRSKNIKGELIPTHVIQNWDNTILALQPILDSMLFL